MISNYTYFKEDVFKCMDTLIQTYNLQVHTDKSALWGLQVWLENSECKIFLNAIFTYPNIGVTYDVYNVKRGKAYSCIYPFELFANYGINQKEYNDYITGLKNTIKLPDEFDFAEYRKALMINEKILMKYYMPIIYK